MTKIREDTRHDEEEEKREKREEEEEYYFNNFISLLVQDLGGRREKKRGEEKRERKKERKKEFVVVDVMLDARCSNISIETNPRNKCNTSDKERNKYEIIHIYNITQDYHHKL